MVKFTQVKLIICKSTKKIESLKDYTRNSNDIYQF